MAESESSCVVLSRKEAIARGLVHYFTGKPCKRKHIALRLVSCCGCCECQKEKMAQYRPAHKERYRELNRRQQLKDREKRLKRNKERYRANPKKFRQFQKVHYEGNAEKIRAKRRVKWADLIQGGGQRYQQELLAGRERVKRWVVENPQQALFLRKVQKQKRRAREKGANGSFSRADLNDIFNGQRGKCAYCACRLENKYHVDHIVPLSKGGANEKRNLQILCRRCNLQKGARDPIIHARSLGMLI